MSTNRRLRPNLPSQGSDSGDSGILNERILVIVFELLKWDIQLLCLTSSINRKFRPIAEHVLWRNLCVSRAPRMVATLASDAHNVRNNGGWRSLAKLLFFCCGWESTRNFRVSRNSPGHFVSESRFCKTSGRSFLTKRCRGDLLYVSDLCEHPTGDRNDDLGIFRGVFKGFLMSRTGAFLIQRHVELEDGVRCPYCGARVWSMTSARLVPRSAARRLGTHDGGLEYFVCVNGHLHGTCWLVPLSSDENDNDGADDGDDKDDEEYDNPTSYDESTSSTGEEVVGR